MTEIEYLEFFFTEDEAIDHCRKRNKGLDSKDPRCVAIIDGPGCGAQDDDPNEHPYGCQCCAYAVVDHETAQDFVDGIGAVPLVVTR